MTPKDVGQWSAIALAMAAAVSAHFGVAQRARDAEMDGEHTRQLLMSHVADAKEALATNQRAMGELNHAHVRDYEALRAQCDATKERVIVLEQGLRQTAEAQSSMRADVESLSSEVRRGFK